MYRTVDSSTWDDPKVVALTPSAKLLFVYLITNRHSHLSGLYYLPVELVILETGLTSKAVEESVAMLSGAGLVHYDAEARVVWIVNMFRYQGRGEKAHRAAAAQCAALHSDKLVSKFLFAYPEVAQYVDHRVLDRVSIGYPDLDDFGTQDQDQDQKQDLMSGPKRPAPSSGPTRKALTEEFLTEFWPNVPHKLGKALALSAYINARLGQGKLQRDHGPTPKETILAGLPMYRDREERRKSSPTFQPHHPTSWLNGRRWEDEAPKATVATPAYKEHPDYVRCRACGDIRMAHCNGPCESPGCVCKGFVER